METSADQVEALRDEAVRAFGAVHGSGPYGVSTRFGSSARNRPAWAGPAPEPGDAERASAEQFDRLQEVAGADPADVAAAVADGIRSRRFYILTSVNRNEAIRRRGEEIISGGPPAAPFP